jgi:V8-like Glu-specific endopeptidase
MWLSSCLIDTVRGQPSVFETPCDTYKGNSGSSIYTDTNLGPMVYGLYVADLPDYSAGLRLTLPYYTWVVERSR